jgi:hypothetical protein
LLPQPPLTIFAFVDTAKKYNNIKLAVEIGERIARYDCLLRDIIVF